MKPPIVLYLFLLAAIYPVLGQAQSTQTITYRITWADLSNDPQEAGFKIDRCQNVGTIGANQTTFLDTILHDPGNTQYCWRVQAYSGTPNVADSLWTEIICNYSPAIPVTSPTLPIRLTAPGEPSPIVETGN